MNLTFASLLTKVWSILAICIIFLFFVFLVITILLANRNDESFIQKLEKESNSLLSFVISKEDSSVKYFTLVKSGDIKTTNLETFLNRFPEKEAKIWINNILDYVEDTPEYLETIFESKKGNKSYYCILRVEKINKEKNLFYFTSHLIASEEETSSLFINRKKLTSKKSIIRILDNFFFKVSGYTLVINFIYSNSSDSSKDIEPVLFSRFKSFFYKFLKDGHYLCELSGKSLLFINTKSKESEMDALKVIDSISSQVKSCLTMKGEQDEINIYIGGVLNSRFKRDGKKLIREASNMANYAKSCDLPNQIQWFNPTNKISNLTDNDYRSEVERIISKKKLRNKFRLIYNVSRMNYLGYLLKTFINDSFFQDYEELHDYASNTKDLKSLFSSLLKDAISKFYIQRPNVTSYLYIPIKLMDSGIILATLPSIPNSSGINLCFIFNQKDISKSILNGNEEEILSNLKFFKEKGFNICVSVDEEGLVLKDNIFALFDSYFVDFSMGKSGVSIDNDIRVSLHSLLEKLIKFKKPIICNDLEGMDAIELLVRSGIEFICSETFSPFSEMILRPDPKILKKIGHMKG